MRGKEGRKGFQTFRRRITPAHAGKRCSGSSCHNAFWDHPRTCGEKSNRGTDLKIILGSPPHMRGKGLAALDHAFAGGITPAHAGKRLRCGILSVQREDHPRTCGEKWHDFVSSNTRLGSPPHMRGKVEDGTELIQRFRITPAHAGKRRKCKQCHLL